MFSAEKEGYRANYGTYNESGLAVFREKGEEVECKYITWGGQIKDIVEIPDTKLALELDFSAFSDFAAYRSMEGVVILKLEN